MVLRELAADALVDAELIEALRTNAKFRSYDHPLTLIAEQKWRSNKPPKRVLTLEALSEWLAGRLDVPYLHIDPLKVDFTAVGTVMSTSYANRYRILPVAVTVVTDTPPGKDTEQPRAWQKPHQANATGTAMAYRPPGSIARGLKPAAADPGYQAWRPE